MNFRRYSFSIGCLRLHHEGADIDLADAGRVADARVGRAVKVPPAVLPRPLQRERDRGCLVRRVGWIEPGLLLELVADRAERALGVDASREMLALARARLAERGLAGHSAVRQADMYRLPLPDAGFDVAALQMVLHYAEDPAAALAEAARVLRPDGVLVVIDLAPHDRAALLDNQAHRWPGFDDAAVAGWFGSAGCAALPPVAVPGPPAVIT